MVLSRYLLLLFLVALPAQNAQSAPAAGQGAVHAREVSPLAPQADSVLIPSWYLKRKDSQRIPVVPKGLLRALVKAASERDHELVQKNIYPMGESNSVPGSDEEIEGVTDTRTSAQHERHSGKSAAGQKVETARGLAFSKNYILASVAVSAVLLLGAVFGYIVMYELLKRDRQLQEDKEPSTESHTYSFWDSKDYSKIKGEAE
ncbi:uncharacterized protein LOC135289475 isoform X2 [Passer domesticus]|uniref:uncharacterized protein LOC135289475 isoform X2 n=1 Tax=Passer domesticus TaxID=48849 RepID=UPI0030FEA885